MGGKGIKISSQGLAPVTKGLVLPLPERGKSESLRKDGELNMGHICLEVSWGDVLMMCSGIS